jgi:hypothetical protein
MMNFMRRRPRSAGSLYGGRPDRHQRQWVHERAARSAEGFSLDNADVEIRKEVNAVSRWLYNDLVGKARTDGQAV